LDSNVIEAARRLVAGPRRNRGSAIRAHVPHQSLGFFIPEDLKPGSCARVSDAGKLSSSEIIFGKLRAGGGEKQARIRDRGSDSASSDALGSTNARNSAASFIRESATSFYGFGPHCMAGVAAAT